jgi:hypothetical protein
VFCESHLASSDLTKGMIRVQWQQIDQALFIGAVSTIFLYHGKKQRSPLLGIRVGASKDTPLRCQRMKPRRDGALALSENVFQRYFNKMVTARIISHRFNRVIFLWELHALCDLTFFIRLYLPTGSPSLSTSGYNRGRVVPVKSGLSK